MDAARSMCALAISLTLACSSPPAARPAAPSPPAAAGDALVIRGGAIYTGDPRAPRADVAIAAGGKFTCVGSAEACLAPPGARVLDLRGGSAVPGLADAHGHVLAFGRALLDDVVDLRGARSPEECARRIAARAAKTPKGTWIEGRGWDQMLFDGAAFPTEAPLSAAVPDHPVFLTRNDGHAAWVNARALLVAHVTASTPDPPSGRLIRGADGAPTGILVDGAKLLVARHLPPPPDDRLEAALLAAMHALVELGLTDVGDAGVSARTLEVYRRLAASDRLPLRVYAMLEGQAPLPVLVRQMDLWRATPRIGRLTVRAVKLFADGAMGSGGALLSEDYADEPGNHGITVTEPDELARRIALVAARGFQPVVHAIGDRAVHETLADFVSAGDATGALRPRVEHLYLLDAADAPLLASSRAVASIQPTHVANAERLAVRLGSAERLRAAHHWRSLAAAGTTLACGSDFPVGPADPRGGLFSAETRISAYGRRTPAFTPEERLSRAEALRCFSEGVAYAEHAELERGRIAVGYDADATLFDRDVMEIPVEDLRPRPKTAPATEGPATRVTATIVGARVELAR